MPPAHTFLPIFLFLSSTKTLTPLPASSEAHRSPPGPAPIMTASYFIISWMCYAKKNLAFKPLDGREDQVQGPCRTEIYSPSNRLFIYSRFMRAMFLIDIPLGQTASHSFSLEQ